MANNLLPVPQSLEIHDSQAAEKWKRFKRAWSSYTLATELNDKTEKVQVATLLTVIGEEAREVFATFTWDTVGDESKIQQVLTKFERYCQPRRNVPFERYIVSTAVCKSLGNLMNIIVRLYSRLRRVVGFRVLPLTRYSVTD